jgi:hypothetical protein
MASDDRMIDENCTGKDMEESSQDLICYYHGICLEGLRKPQKKTSVRTAGDRLTYESGTS